MDSTAKLLLEEMKKLGDRLDTRLSSLETCVDAVGDRFKSIDDKAEELEAWKQGVDSSVANFSVKLDAVETLVGKEGIVEELKSRVSNLSNKIECMVADHGGSATGILPKPETGATTPPAGKPSVGPDGHCLDKHLQENGFGSVMAYTQLPGKGTIPSSSSFSLPNFDSYHQHTFRIAHPVGTNVSNPTGRLPKLPFPTFDGDNHKLWQSHCEKYFDMYAVEPSTWVGIASMCFDGPVARWLQSINSQLHTIT
jgi:hypothetical protein